MEASALTPSTAENSVFVSYASPDRARVEPFVDALRSRGIDIWVDFQQLKPGQNWDFEIKRALDKASIIIMFVSDCSVDRRGYVQRELRIALDKRDERLIDDIYLIPVLLDDAVSLPNQLRSIQFVRASDSNCVDKIEEVVRTQLGEQNVKIEVVSNDVGIHWSRLNVRESWEGLPGYEIVAQFLRLRSDQYADLDLVNNVLAAEVSKTIIDHKALKYNQDPSCHNFGQSRFWRTSTCDVSFSDPSFVGRVVSIRIIRSWYNAGAAHGGTHVSGINFCFDPILWLGEPASLFADANRAFPVIQEVARRELKSQLEARGSGPDEQWITSGTENWNQFSSFSFSKEGVDYIFQEYQVACYADGTLIVTVPFSEIWPEIKPELLAALEIEHFKWQQAQNG